MRHEKCCFRFKVRHINSRSLGFRPVPGRVCVNTNNLQLLLETWDSECGCGVAAVRESYTRDLHINRVRCLCLNLTHGTCTYIE